MSPYKVVDGRMVKVEEANRKKNGQRSRDSATWFVIEGELRDTLLSFATQDGVSVAAMSAGEKGKVVNAYVRSAVDEWLHRQRAARGQTPEAAQPDKPRAKSAKRKSAADAPEADTLANSQAMGKS